MKPANRLRRGADIQRVRNSGKSWAVGPVVLYAAQQTGERGAVRAAFVTSKKLGKAVRRNQAKRWLREAFRERIPYIKEGWDLVWIARPSIFEVGYERIRKSVFDALQRGRLIAPTEQVAPRALPPATAEVRNEDSGPVEHPALPADDQPGSTPDMPVRS